MSENPCDECANYAECADDWDKGFHCCASWYRYQATAHFDNFKPRPEVAQTVGPDHFEPYQGAKKEADRDE